MISSHIMEEAWATYIAFHRGIFKVWIPTIVLNKLSLPKPAPHKRDQTFRAFIRFVKRVPRTDLGCPNDRVPVASRRQCRVWRAAGAPGLGRRLARQHAMAVGPFGDSQQRIGRQSFSPGLLELGGAFVIRVQHQSTRGRSSPSSCRCSRTADSSATCIVCGSTPRVAAICAETRAGQFSHASRSARASLKTWAMACERSTSSPLSRARRTCWFAP